MSMDLHTLEAEYKREPMFFDRRNRNRIEEFIESVEKHDPEMGMRLRMWLWRVDRLIETGKYHPYPPSLWFIRYEMVKKRFGVLANGLDRVANKDENP